MLPFPFTAMATQKYSLFFVLLAINVYDIAGGDVENVNKSPAAAVGSPVFAPAGNSLLHLSLLSFPEDEEISEYCSELLSVFGQRYEAYVKCLIPAARPVKVCQNCFSGFVTLHNVYQNISSDQVRAVSFEVFGVFFCVMKRLYKRSQATFSQSRGCDVTV